MACLLPAAELLPSIRASIDDKRGTFGSIPEVAGSRTVAPHRLLPNQARGKRLSELLHAFVADLSPP